MAKAKKNKAKDVESVKLELTVHKRILLGGMLPKEGNFATMTLAKDIDAKVIFSEDELKKHKIENLPDGRVKFNSPKKGKKIDFSSAEIQLLKTQVDGLDKTNKITTEQLDLCIQIKNS